MDWKRRILALSWRYARAGDHYVHIEREHRGGLEGSVKRRYTCMDCGEEHSRRNLFSDVCGDGEYNTGGVTKTAKFRAQDITDDHHIWFRLLEGEKRGLDFVLPVFHEEHDTSLRQALQNVEEGRVYQVTFVTDNAKGTAHYCGGLTELSA